MEITAANIGDVINLSSRSSPVLIEDVTDRLVVFRQESGDRYATYRHEIDGTVVQDPKRLTEFHRNSVLGNALTNAQISAIDKLITDSSDLEERKEANAVLGIVKSMLKHLDARVPDRQTKENSKQPRSLDSLIQKAQKHSVEKQRDFISHPEKDAYKGR